MNEQKALKTIEEFAKKLPKFPDGRIDYTNSSAAPVILVFVEYENKILLLKRSEKVSNYRGKWHVVGGFLDEIRTVKEKVFEELREELGISEDEIASIRLGNPHKVADKNINKIWLVHPVLVEMREEPKIKLDWEHTEYKWVKPEELGEYDTPPELDKSLKRVLKK